MVSDGTVSSNTGEDYFVRQLAASQRSLRGYIVCMLGPDPAVEDVLQETNADLWEKRSDFDQSRPFTPWAIRFAFQRVRDYRKKVARSKLLFDDGLLAQVHETVLSSVGDEKVPHLQHCLGRLNQDDKSLIESRYYLRNSVDAISRSMRTTPGAIATRLYRIRARLRACINRQVAQSGQ